MEPITPGPDTGGEDLVVLRLEGLGAFAVPVAVLDGFRVPEAPPADGVRAAGEAGIATGLGFQAVPLILDGDFMRATMGRRRELVVDRLGCVGVGRDADQVPGSEEELAASGGTLDRSRPTTELLTGLELQVARMAVGGATNRDIAGQLFVSPRTVENHLGAVYRKLGVGGRSGLVARAATDDALGSPR